MLCHVNAADSYVVHAQSALKGMPWIDYMQVWHPDHLHMFGKGILERACRELLNMLEDAALDDIAHQLDVRWQHSFCPYEMPFGGLSATQNRITTKQQVMLVRALVVPLALHGSQQALALSGMHAWHSAVLKHWAMMPACLFERRCRARSCLTLILQQ